MNRDPKCVSPLAGSDDEHASFIENVPVFINLRDRLSCLELLLEWLEKAGHKNIILLDNASSFPPLLKFLEKAPYRVIRLKRNLSHTALWRLRQLREMLQTHWFVYTDPDIIPDDSCPLDAVGHMYDTLQAFPEYLKIGLALRTDDIPDHYHLKQYVVDWEEALYGREIAPGVFQADVDTTFALHRPRTPYITGPAIRLRGRYQARHLPWYLNSADLDADERYYRAHLKSRVTTWNVGGAPLPNKPPGPGGVAARIDCDARAAYREFLYSKTGKLMHLLWKIRHPFGHSSPDWAITDGMDDSSVRDSLLNMLRSKEWYYAWRLGEGVRRNDYLFWR